MKTPGATLSLLVFSISLAMPTAVSAASTPPAPANERQAVLATVQRFFDTMTARDVEGARAVLVAEGQYFSVRDDASGVVLRRRTHEEYLAGLAAGKDRSLERMWDATVMVHERVAMVWAPYDFHRNGKFSHNGVDVFTLVKAADGWKIAGVAFTVEPAPPTRHPAGPPPAAAP